MLSPLGEFLFQILYFSVLELPFGFFCVCVFLFTMFLFIVSAFSCLSLSMVIIALKSLRITHLGDLQIGLR